MRAPLSGWRGPYSARIAIRRASRLGEVDLLAAEAASEIP